MHIPKSFNDALERAYRNKSQLDKLFTEQKSFIMRLVRYSLRYKPWQVISDENDLYQEACIWILHFMWKWDDERGVSLSRYVTHNVGVRLKNQIDMEMAKKRNPKTPNYEIVNESYENNGGQSNVIKENEINSNVPTPEEIIALRQAYERIDRELPLLARELLECLMLENGNLFKATRILQERGRIRGLNKSDDALRQWLRRNFIPKLRTIFEEEQIIST